MTASPVQRTTTPPRRRDRLIAWLALMGCLAVATAVMLVELDGPPVVTDAEALAVATAVQTHRRQAQFVNEPWSWERLTPYKDGLRQLESPPGRTWLHLLAVASLDADEPLEDYVYRARLVSVAFVLLTVAAVFWAGMAIGGVVTASMSALICLSMPVLIVQAHQATTEPIALGLSLLSIAAALWAIRPLRPAATLMRQGIGWSVCGMALGAATLVSGPIVLPTVLGPILAMLLLAPHRVGHVLGLIAAVLITVLMVTPWAGYVHLQQPDAWRVWIAAMQHDAGQDLPDLLHTAGYRLLLILAGAAPWTLWLAAALVQPFSTSSEGARNRLFLGWTWFLVATLLLAAAPGPATLASVLAAIAAASVPLGQLFRHGADLSAEGRHARFWRWLRWPQWGAMLFVCLAAPAAGLGQDLLIERGWLGGPVVATMHGLVWVGMAAVGVGILAVAIRPIVKHYPARAVVCWSLWSVVMAGLLAFPVARGPLVRSDAQAVGPGLAAIVDDRPVLILTNVHPQPDPKLMFYADLAFAPLTAEQMRNLVRQQRDLYLLAPRYYSPGQPWRAAAELRAHDLRLWYCPPLQPPETPM